MPINIGLSTSRQKQYLTLKSRLIYVKNCHPLHYYVRETTFSTIDNNPINKVVMANDISNLSHWISTTANLNNSSNKT